MSDAKTTYIILNYGISIIPFMMGLFLLLFPVPKSHGLKPYVLSRKALAIAYLMLGSLNALEGVLMGDQLGEDIFLIANICLVVAMGQAYLFTYALVILMEPSFASNRWNRVQWCCIAGGFIAVITGFWVGVDMWQYIIFGAFLAFYLYQLIHYTLLFLRKKRSYIARVDNYFGGGEMYWLRWVDVAFLSALLIGISALFSAIFSDIWFNNVFIAACCVFYFAFALKYAEYPQLFDDLQHVIKSDDDVPGHVEERSTMIEKLEVWIKEKRFVGQYISVNDLARELDVKPSTILFYINVHLQMNFRSWLLYLREKEQREALKEMESRHSELFAEIEQLAFTGQHYLDPDFLSREEMAQKLATNTVYISAAVREKTGLSYGDYIKNLRLDYAHGLLSDPQKSEMLILDIATRSGFKSLRTFHRAFKDRFGITPGEGKDR